MFLSETEIDYEHLTIFFAHYEVRGFYVSVDEAPLVDLSHRNNHFHQNLDSNLEVVALFKTASGFCQVDAEEVHNDEVLLSILYVLVGVSDVLKSY